MSTDTTIQTYSGALLDLLDPDPQAIHLEDIAHHLSQINRFTGATTRPYSVATHSCFVYVISQGMSNSRDVWAWALLHDAEEAYIGDVSTPMKRALGPAYTALRDGVRAAVATRFNLPTEIPKLVHVADALALAAEAHALLPGGPRWPLAPNDFRPPHFLHGGRETFLGLAGGLGLG